MSSTKPDGSVSSAISVPSTLVDGSWLAWFRVLYWLVGSADAPGALLVSFGLAVPVEALIGVASLSGDGVAGSVPMEALLTLPLGDESNPMVSTVTVWLPTAPPCSMSTAGITGLNDVWLAAVVSIMAGFHIRTAGCCVVG